MQYSPIVLIRLSKLEGCSLVPYKDVGGRWTNGYGHLMGPSEPMRTLTPDEAWHQLGDDVERIAKGVDQALFGVQMTQPQYDAVIIFAFNIGVQEFAKSTMLKLIKAGDIQGAADEFGKWIHVLGKPVEGLINRRAEERALFLSAPEAVA